MHEFETFILVDSDQLELFYPDHQNAVARLKNDIAGIEPERVNERPTHAPSKRIIRRIAEYEDMKTIVAPSLAEIIGLQALRTACPHFNEWLTKLENLK